MVKSFKCHTMVKRFLFCDNCGEEMVISPIIKTSNPPIYEYICPKCSCTSEQRTYFPYIDYILEDTPVNDGIPLCEYRNTDRCNLYCDGYDTLCDDYYVKDCVKKDSVYCKKICNGNNWMCKNYTTKNT